VTLREYGQSIAQWWDRYLTEITTQNVLDWSIGHLILTVVGGLILFGIGAALLEAGFVLLAKAWEKTGLPYLWVRLDKRFGEFFAALIMVGVTIVFLTALGLVFALAEIAFS
jgi:hypothetical protein